MILATLLAVLFAPAQASAQSLPDAPTLEQAVDHVGEATLPSYADWQKRKQKEFWERKPEDAAAPGAGLSLNKDANDPNKRFMTPPRFTTESLDINLSRPTPRLTFGVGYAERDMIVADRALSHEDLKYGFVKFELSRPKDAARRILRVPTATYSETDTGPKPRVSREEFTQGLKELKR